MASVVKRSGRSEPYLEAKLHDSVRRACLSVRALEGEAHLLADRITRAVTDWTSDKADVTSHDLRVRAATHLTALHPEAAYAYLALDSTI